MSQTDLARALGVSFQQVQKYEKGLNRIGAGRLMQIADALGVPATTLLSGGASAGDGGREVPLELVQNSRALRLLRAFNRIKNRDLQQAIMVFVEANAEGER